MICFVYKFKTVVKSINKPLILIYPSLLKCMINKEIFLYLIRIPSPTYKKNRIRIQTSRTTQFRILLKYLVTDHLRSDSTWQDIVFLIFIYKKLRIPGLFSPLYTSKRKNFRINTIILQYI